MVSGIWIQHGHDRDSNRLRTMYSHATTPQLDWWKITLAPRWQHGFDPPLEILNRIEARCGVVLTC